ncbi:hypothetical protein AC578_262 [Pseudocercospora eumusae]|uniref:Uncharacterized protein n=1 Tax=Pseudocercospora eumusae TaxID=321146 RepID=A0A139H705_9PEZI|nr:hypothetical protein AC578_262 [Pseudocercospora eumusae]
MFQPKRPLYISYEDSVYLGGLQQLCQVDPVLDVVEVCRAVVWLSTKALRMSDFFVLPDQTDRSSIAADRGCPFG